jgi:hypothetical protein
VFTVISLAISLHTTDDPSMTSASYSTPKGGSHKLNFILIHSPQQVGVCFLAECARSRVAGRVSTPSRGREMANKRLSNGHHLVQAPYTFESGVANRRSCVSFANDQVITHRYHIWVCGKDSRTFVVNLPPR